MQAVQVDDGVVTAQWEGPGPDAPAGMIAVESFPALGATYDAEAETFTAPEAPDDYGLSVDARAFQLLFTKAQRKAIRTAAESDADVADFVALAEVPVAIRLKHPTTLAGLSLMVSKSLITSDDKTRISNGEAPA